jgi:hypothetical protein
MEESGNLHTMYFGHYVLIVIISEKRKKGEKRRRKKLISNIKTIFSQAR